MFSRHRSSRFHVIFSFVLILVSVTCAALLLQTDRLRAQEASTHRMGSSHGEMTAEEMDRWVSNWFATHPIVGRQSSLASAAPPAATFQAIDKRFDYDGDPTGTAIDTARILVGETVLWQQVSRSHTVTSGTGWADPSVGSLFDVPLTSAEPTFQYTYTAAGTFPFFCRPHEDDPMKGVVVVDEVVDVESVPNGSVRLGFTTPPFPNPTSSRASFHFALKTEGKVRITVIDSRGRTVAVPVNGDFAAGTYAASWDGRASSGERVAPGMYFLNLRVPGFQESRSLVVLE